MLHAKETSAIFATHLHEIVDFEEIENMKKIDALALETRQADRFKNIKYVQREEDPELKLMFEKSQADYNNLEKTLDGRVDG